MVKFIYKCETFWKQICEERIINMGFFDFVKQSDFIVCIDSDGCAMDTMEVKHRECFGPQWIYTYGLEEQFDECMKLWLDINLYSFTRGINRFKGLALALLELEKRGYKFDGLDEFVTWTKEAKELSNPALMAYTQKSSSECVEKHCFGVFVRIEQFTIYQKMTSHLKM